MRQTLSAEAFTRFYEEHADYAYAIAFSYLHCPADAEDVVADVFLQIFEQNMSFHDRNHAKAWLTVAVRNRCKNLLKSWIRRNRSDLEDAEQLSAAGSSETREALDALYTMPERYRLPLILIAVKGYSYDEASKILQINESTLRTRVMRARKILKKKLGSDGE